MVTVDGIEYLTTDEAARRCREFAAANPGTTFHNWAHSKCVRRTSTQQEQDAEKAAGRWPHITITVYEWNKLYTDANVLKTHPELKGLWQENKNLGVRA